MRYRTFRAFALFGVTGAAIFGWLAYSKSKVVPAPPPGTEPVAVPLPPVTIPSPDPVPAPVPAPAPAPTPHELPLRDLDRRIMSELLGKPASSDKVKDVYSTSKERVSLYTDAPATTPNRVKIDLDRNDRFEEKWEVDGTTVTKRLVSTKDDEVYDEQWKLEGDKWIRTKSGLAPPPVPHATEPGPKAERIALRPNDQRILDHFGKAASGDKIKDALGKTGPKVNITVVDGSTVWNHAKVDFERNEKWNEKWDWKDGKVTRQVAPNDDEVYTKKYKLEGREWVEVLQK